MARNDREPTTEEIADYLADVPVGRVAEALGLLAVRAMEARADRTPHRLLRPDQITDLYGLDRRWVYAHAEELGAIKTGRRTMFVPESKLVRYLEDHSNRHRTP